MFKQRLKQILAIALPFMAGALLYHLLNVYLKKDTLSANQLNSAIIEAVQRSVIISLLCGTLANFWANRKKEK
jgi:hypothetical protein